jgi:hypothetical protein
MQKMGKERPVKTLLLFILSFSMLPSCQDKVETKKELGKGSGKVSEPVELPLTKDQKPVRKSKSENQPSNLVKKEKTCEGELWKLAAAKPINQVDPLGKKDGLWVDTSEYFLDFQNFDGGLLNGKYKVQSNSDGKLRLSGFYKNGKQSGEWKEFYNDCSIASIAENIETNHDITIFRYGDSFMPKYKSYVRQYYPKTVILLAEGELLFDAYSDEESYVHYSSWKTYEADGTLSDVATYKNGFRLEQGSVEFNVDKSRDSVHVVR